MQGLRPSPGLTHTHNALLCLLCAVLCCVVLWLLFLLQVSEDPLRVTAVHLKDDAYVADDLVKATSMELVNTMKDLLNMNPLYGEQFKTLMSLTGAWGGG